MTFRLPAEVAHALRQLPSQTAFVETALREALGRLCPLCHGTGCTEEVRLNVSDFRDLRLGRLDRQAARGLKALVRLGRQLLATELELEPANDAGELEFRLAREDELLLAGSIPRGEPRTPEIKLTH